MDRPGHDPGVLDQKRVGAVAHYNRQEFRELVANSVGPAPLQRFFGGLART
jgi:hypothetical protein